MVNDLQRGSKEWWEDVENKINIICGKFNNLSPWQDDLRQELRLHAYYYSEDYHNLYRKAIDFWRKIQNTYQPEVPYYEFGSDVTGESSVESRQSGDNTIVNKALTKRVQEDRYDNKSNSEDYGDYDRLLQWITHELDKPGYSKPDQRMIDLSKFLLRIIIEDIDPRLNIDNKLNKSKSAHYINDRLNLSWIYEETGIGYKRLVQAMKYLEDVIQSLAMRKKIDIPEEYLKDYYDRD